MSVAMANVIRTEAELQRRHGVGQHADSCDGCLMADTIRALWQELVAERNHRDRTREAADVIAAENARLRVARERT